LRSKRRGSHAAFSVHAPAPAGTAVNRSFADIRTQQGTDPFVRFVDAAYRVAAFDRYTIIVSHANLQAKGEVVITLVGNEGGGVGDAVPKGELEMHPLTRTRHAVKGAGQRLNQKVSRSCFRVL